MTVHVPISQLDRILKQTAVTLAAEREREEKASVPQPDIVRWAEDNFYILDRDTLAPRLIQLLPHQKCIMRLMFTRNERGEFPFTTLIYSTVKQSGKSTVSGIIARWMAETQTVMGRIYTVGNDLQQAKERGYFEAYQSIRLDPNFRRNGLPGRWLCQKLTLECLTTGSQIHAIAVDAPGSAGGKPALSVWTELWGFEHEDSIRFWDELAPVPTIRDSIRFVDTYAGWQNQSTLLYGLYKHGIESQRLTAHDLALAGQSNALGESYEELLHAFAETEGDPDAKVPIWIDANSGLCMYWDTGYAARRMPWLQGERGERYYRDETVGATPNAFRQHHFNEWVSPESEFVPIELWDLCYDSTLPPLIDKYTGEPDKKTQLIVGVDAASTADCFAIVVVSRAPSVPDGVAVRAYRVWDPKESGGRIDYSEPEEFLRTVCKRHNVQQIAYDPHQLESMSQRLRKDGISWVKPFGQMEERLRADRQLRDLITQRRLHHFEDPKGRVTADGEWRPPMLRQHILNATAKLEKDQASKLRIVQRAGKKVDLAVALSMAASRCLALLLDEL